MSIEYPCVYFYGNGMCSYGGDRSEANICVFGPCENETPSNGDMIRRMSDEDLAVAAVRYKGTEKRTTPCGGHEKIFHGPHAETCGTDSYAIQLWKKWLQKPAEKANDREE